MISLPAHKTAAESVDSMNGTDLSAALAYIATAEGAAATIAERACDRAGLDYATCPAEILDAAERRAAELAAPEVPPEVQAVLDARRILAAAEAEEDALPPFVYGMGDAEIAHRNRVTGAAGFARRALRQFEGVIYVPDATPVGSLRAANARVNALHNEIGTIEGALRTAKLRNASKAIAKHEAALIPLRAALVEHLAIRSALEAVVYPD